MKWEIGQNARNTQSLWRKRRYNLSNDSVVTVITEGARLLLRCFYGTVPLAIACQTAFTDITHMILPYTAVRQDSTEDLLRWYRYLCGAGWPPLYRGLFYRLVIIYLCCLRTHHVFISAFFLPLFFPFRNEMPTPLSPHLRPARPNPSSSLLKGEGVLPVSGWILSQIPLLLPVEAYWYGINLLSMQEGQKSQ